MFLVYIRTHIFKTKRSRKCRFHNLTSLELRPMPMHKCKGRIKYNNVFWHNNHACFSLMSQAGVSQHYRGWAGLSHHQMYAILVRGTYLMGHLTLVYMPVLMQTWHLWACELLWCADTFLESWDRTWKGIYKWEYISWLSCGKTFAFSNYVNPWSESILFQFCTAGQPSSFLFLSLELRDVSLTI